MDVPLKARTRASLSDHNLNVNRNNSRDVVPSPWETLSCRRDREDASSSRENKMNHGRDDSSSERLALLAARGRYHRAVQHYGPHRERRLCQPIDV
jgi:hypothetical protein